MTNKSSPIPAIVCPLSGLHLIEASAGTGKTWTLTGILLRLLLEKNTPPEKIVATTFTRAAASEIQERLNDRLQGFLQVCLWLQDHFDRPTLYQLSDQEKQQFIAEHEQKVAGLDDAIHQHLLLQLLAKHPTELDKTIRRLSLLTLSLDKLFVGTLDSLANKWLVEFGAEMGISTRPTIVPKADELLESVVHDCLRALHAHICYRMPILYRHLFFEKIKDGKPVAPILPMSVFGDVAKFLKELENVQHFLTAPIDQVDDFDKLNDKIFVEFENELSSLLTQGFAEFEPYWQPDALKSFGMNGQKPLTKQFYRLATFIDVLKNKGLAGFDECDKDTKTLLTLFVDGTIDDPVFNAAFEQNKSIWRQLPLKKLTKLGQLYVDYATLDKRFKSALMVELAVALRQNSDTLLEEQNQTTFAKQMGDLARALTGKEGQKLARHIRHNYPVALIDEVQDINGEQMALLKNLYLNANAKDDVFNPARKNQGFFLCVGDPKQAIYRFRGGDVLNYNALKQLGLNGDLTIATNRRSNPALIQALNDWFASPADEFGENICYQPIGFADDRKNALHLDWQRGEQSSPFLPTTALAVLQFEKGDKDSIQANLIAQHINSLLQTGKLTEKNGTKRAVLPSDVAVLASSHRVLNRLKTALGYYNIVGLTAKNTSIFASEACLALYELLSASLDDGDDKLGAVLKSLFLLPLAKIEQVLQDETQKLRLIAFLAKIRKEWTEFGIGAGLSLAFRYWRFADWQDNGDMSDLPLWQYLASCGVGERFLTDLWQLQTLVCDEQLFGIKPVPAKFLAQLARYIAKPPEDDKCQRLTVAGEQAVSLLTIHRSKGLEYPIVYVLGLASDLKESSEGLYPYVADNERRLSPVGERGAVNFKKQNAIEQYDEKKRLGYVALTRASEQVFVVVKNKDKDTASTLKTWGFYDKTQFVLPERLVGKVDVLPMASVATHLITTPYQPTAIAPTPIVYPDWHSVFGQTHFFGTHRTSFTNLAYLFDGSKNNPAINLSKDHSQADANTDELLIAPDTANDEWEDELVEGRQSVQTNPNDGNAIRSQFVKGKDGGLFLHKVLELGDFSSKADPKSLSKLIDDVAKRQKLPQEYQSAPSLEGLTTPTRHFELVDWLFDVAHCPLVSGATLAKLSGQQKYHEMPFLLGGGNWTTEQLFAILSQFEWSIGGEWLAFLDNRRLFECLSGEMDLVYEWEGRYFVLDYKSNFLATHWQDYTTPVLQRAMHQNGYWLQAIIYQVALHRLLKLRLPNYDGSQLGAVEYVFVRGIAPQSAQSALVSTGSLRWQVPFELVLALDELF